MTVFYPDVSSDQEGISFRGSYVAMVKATQGDWYTNPDYTDAKARAASVGAEFCAYHFLEAGNANAQANHAFNVVGKGVSLMLDWETTTGSNPSVADAQTFVSHYKALGGTIVLNYLPNWYWSQLGFPNLEWFAGQGMYLVTSDYTSYSDNGVGWVGYGGMSVAVWQYTSSATFNGYHPVDFNAFKGSPAQFAALTKGVAVKPESLVLVEGDTGSAVAYLQTRLNVWGAKLAVDSDFGPAVLAAVKAFQTAHKLSVDGQVGPATWAALDKTPVAPVAPGEFPVPAGFAVAGKLVSVGVKWDADTVLVNGKLPTGYTVQAWHLGKLVASQVVTATDARFDNLVPGNVYNFVLWANGGTRAPAGAQITVTA